ncbi:hypothetical protein PAMP_012510 [Pampus punctatissimus]
MKKLYSVILVKFGEPADQDSKELFGLICQFVHEFRRTHAEVQGTYHKVLLVLWNFINQQLEQEAAGVKGQLIITYTSCACVKWIAGRAHTQHSTAGNSWCQTRCWSGGEGYGRFID